MNPENETIYCANCGVEIAWLPVIKDGRAYCCQECIQFSACTCAGVFELEEERLANQHSMLEAIAAFPG